MSIAVTSRYVGIARGALVMTGNCCGLDKQEYGSESVDQYSPGNLGSQGVFLTVNNTNLYPENWKDIYEENQTPSPVGILRSDQVSSTNPIGSKAKLYIPDTVNKILHAELIWFANLYPGVNGNQSITFTHPNEKGEDVRETIDASKFEVSFDLVSNEIPINWRIYVRSADVTPYIMKGEQTYTVEGLNAIVMGGNVDANCSGWCMMVAYEDLSMDYNNMSMYVMAVPVAQVTGYELTEVEISNIVTPSSGTLKGKGVIAAAEGDIRWAGDYVTFGNTPKPTTRLSIGSHTETDFFVGEISIADNDPDIGGSSVMGEIDERGSMGRNNHDATNSVIGARHGLDIARVDISDSLVHGQTHAYIDFGTKGDVYMPIAFGGQIMVSPSITKEVDKEVADVGDILTYTSTIVNGGSNRPWMNVYFQDDLQPGTEFVEGTVKVYYNGVLQSGFEEANPVIGFALKDTVTSTDIITVVFKIRIVDYSLIIDAIVYNESKIAYTLTDSSGNSYRVGETSNRVETVLQHGELIIRKKNDPTGIVTCTNQIKYTVQIENIGTVNTNIAVGGFQDLKPEKVTYVGEVDSSSNTTEYDATSIAFNEERTAIVNVKPLEIVPNEIITITFMVTPIC